MQHGCAWLLPHGGACAPRCARCCMRSHCCTHTQTQRWVLSRARYYFFLSFFLSFFFFPLNCCHFFLFPHFPLPPPPPHPAVSTMHGVKPALAELRCKGGTGGCMDPERCRALGLPEGWGTAREQHPLYLQSGTERREHKGLLSALGSHSGQARAKKRLHGNSLPGCKGEPRWGGEGWAEQSLWVSPWPGGGGWHR